MVNVRRKNGPTQFFENLTTLGHTRLNKLSDSKQHENRNTRATRGLSIQAATGDELSRRFTWETQEYVVPLGASRTEPYVCYRPSSKAPSAVVVARCLHLPLPFSNMYSFDTSLIWERRLRRFCPYKPPRADTLGW